MPCNIRKHPIRRGKLNMKYSPHCQFQQYHIYINVLNMKISEHIYIYYAYLYLSVSNSTAASKSDGGINGIPSLLPDLQHTLLEMYNIKSKPYEISKIGHVSSQFRNKSHLKVLHQLFFYQ